MHTAALSAKGLRQESHGRVKTHRAGKSNSAELKTLATKRCRGSDEKDAGEAPLRRHAVHFHLSLNVSANAAVV